MEDLISKQQELNRKFEDWFRKKLALDSDLREQASTVAAQQTGLKIGDAALRQNRMQLSKDLKALAAAQQEIIRQRAVVVSERAAAAEVAGPEAQGKLDALYAQLQEEKLSHAQALANTNARDAQLAWSQRHQDHEEKRFAQDLAVFLQDKADLAPSLAQLAQQREALGEERRKLALTKASLAEGWAALAAAREELNAETRAALRVAERARESEVLAAGVREAAAQRLEEGELESNISFQIMIIARALKGITLLASRESCNGSLQIKSG